MKINELKARLRKERPMTTVTLRMPEDVVKELKQLAPILGFSGYQPLIRAYIGQGMRVDLERLQSNPEIVALLDRLRNLGVEEEVISQAFQETFHTLPQSALPQSAPHPAYTRRVNDYQQSSGRVLAEEKASYVISETPES